MLANRLKGIEPGACDGDKRPRRDGAAKTVPGRQKPSSRNMAAGGGSFQPALG